MVILGTWIIFVNVGIMYAIILSFGHIRADVYRFISHDWRCRKRFRSVLQKGRDCSNIRTAQCYNRAFTLAVKEHGYIFACMLQPSLGQCIKWDVGLLPWTKGIAFLCGFAAGLYLFSNSALASGKAAKTLAPRLCNKRRLAFSEMHLPKSLRRCRFLAEKRSASPERTTEQRWMHQSKGLSENPITTHR